MVWITSKPKPKRLVPAVPVMMNLRGVFFWFKSQYFFSKHYLVSSHSIPFSEKLAFVATTTMRLMSHVFDMARDIIQIIFLKRLINGAPYIFIWVSTLSSLINVQLQSHVPKAIFHYARAYQRPCTLYVNWALVRSSKAIFVYNICRFSQN